MRRRLIGVALAALVALAGLNPLGVAPAQAGADFCDADPIIAINGVIVSIATRIPVTAAPYVSSANPVQITVYVPKNTQVAGLVGYTGAFAEQLVIARTDKASTKTAADIVIEVKAPPPPAGVAAYPVSFSATTALGTWSGASTSGLTGRLTIQVPWQAPSLDAQYQTFAQLVTQSFTLQPTQYLPPAPKAK